MFSCDCTFAVERYSKIRDFLLEPNTISDSFPSPHSNLHLSFQSIHITLHLFSEDDDDDDDDGDDDDELFLWYG